MLLAAVQLHFSVRYFLPGIGTLFLKFLFAVRQLHPRFGQLLFAVIQLLFGFLQLGFIGIQLFAAVLQLFLPLSYWLAALVICFSMVEK